MRVVIFGAGSLGSALGAVLAKRNEVVLIGRRRNMSAIRSKGLRVVGDLNMKADLGAYESVRGIDPPDLLVLATKSYDTASAIVECKSWVADDTKVLTLQNGLGNLESLRAWKGRKAFGGTTTMGANLVKPAKVKVSGLGRTVIGSDLDAAGASSIAKMFTESGLPTVVKKGIEGEIWAKAVISACINPTTAILRVRNGGLLESPSVGRLLRDLCFECESVAAAARIQLPHRSMIGRVRAVARNTRNNRSSMLQDVERGKRTEVAQINGAFVKYGSSQGVRTPLNLTMLAMVESLGKG